MVTTVWRTEHASGSGRNFRSPLTPLSVAPAHRATPAHPIFGPTPLHFPLPPCSHALMANITLYVNS